MSEPAHRSARSSSSRGTGARRALVALAIAALGGWGYSALRSPAPPAGGAAAAADEIAAADASTADSDDDGTAGNDSAGNASSGATPRRPRNVPANPFPDRIKVPEGIFDGGVGWLNASGPISMKDLRGKVVLLDFWTFCCINCIHILPDLKYLEEKYDKELVVIGVHSAKFENEKESENIRRAIQRYEIRHPVVNDANMIIWRKFGVTSWPTLVLIDPEGYLCGIQPGEGHRDLFDRVIERLIEHHDAKGTLDRTPVRFDLELAKLPPTPLRFPGKVLADEPGGRLFVSDSNYNRIVIAGLDGKLIDVIGTGEIGRRDGGFDEAQFDHPQGMALVGEKLYVADTENHLIRVVHLDDRKVTTLAGTGQQSRGRGRGGALRTTALNSPWDLLHRDGFLYIAMAGPHQLWIHKLGSNTLSVYAGSGLEDIRDGALAESALAQPSGMAVMGNYFYVCDSEGSSIRQVPFNAREPITTIVGTHDLPMGRSLFSFGDRDGAGANARLQHPLGITAHDGALYVADSYNHKIKKLTRRPDGWTSTTWLGTGEPGTKLDPPQFSEPAGLTVAGNKLIIADTNNHRLLTADFATGKVEPFTIEGLKSPAPRESGEDDDGVMDAEFSRVAAQRIAADGTLTIEIAITLPPEHKLTPLAPVTYRVDPEEGQTLFAADLPRRGRAKMDGTTAQITLLLSANSGRASLRLSTTFGYCREGNGGLCRVSTARWTVPVEVAAGAPRQPVRLTTPPIELPADAGGSHD